MPTLEPDKEYVNIALRIPSIDYANSNYTYENMSSPRDTLVSELRYRCFTCEMLANQRQSMKSKESKVANLKRLKINLLMVLKVA